MKSPAFQFYCGDWLRAAELRMCSIAARGLWIDMIAFMHQAQPYGHLIFAGQPVSEVQLARMVGESTKATAKLLQELKGAGVYSVDDNGVIYCRRMVRDELERAAWREQQRAHRDRVKTETERQHSVSLTSGDVSGQSQAVLPSSSSSSKPKPERTRASRLPPDWVLPEDWKGWALKAQPSWTQTHVAKVSANFRDYWIAAPKGLKLDWLATWRTWVRREGPMPGAITAASHSTSSTAVVLGDMARAREQAAPMPEQIRKQFVHKPGA
jgi:hypothetical protein